MLTFSRPGVALRWLLAPALVVYGCDVAQGYHLSRPLPADELLDWVRRDRSGGNRLERVGAEGRVHSVVE